MCSAANQRPCHWLNTCTKHCRNHSKQTFCCLCACSRCIKHLHVARHVLSVFTSHSQTLSADMKSKPGKQIFLAYAGLVDCQQLSVPKRNYTSEQTNLKKKEWNNLRELSQGRVLRRDCGERTLSVEAVPFLIGVSFRRIEFQHALTLRMLVRLREHSG